MKQIFLSTNQVFFSNVEISSHIKQLLCNFAAVLPVYDRYVIFIELCAFHIRIYLQTIECRGNIFKFSLKSIINPMICFKFEKFFHISYF